MTPRVKIINACSEHIEAIAEIESRAILGGWSRRAFEEAAAAPGKIILAAELEGRTVGFANASFVLDEGEILNIAVDEKYRHAGIGKALLYSLLESFPCEIENVYLEVRSENSAAISLYEKAGFESCGLRKKYYADPVDDAVIMKKNIKDDE